MYENANYKTIVVDNSSLKFLEKYGFNVISLDDRDITDKAINDAKNLIYFLVFDFLFQVFHLI